MTHNIFAIGGVLYDNIIYKHLLQSAYYFYVVISFLTVTQLNHQTLVRQNVDFPQKQTLIFRHFKQRISFTCTLIFTHTSQGSRDGWAGWAIAQPGYGRSFHPISTEAGRLCPHRTTCPPSFRQLPTSLPQQLIQERKKNKACPEM